MTTSSNMDRKNDDSRSEIAADFERLRITIRACYLVLFVTQVAIFVGVLTLRPR